MLKYIFGFLFAVLLSYGNNLNINPNWDYCDLAGLNKQQCVLYITSKYVVRDDGEYDNAIEFIDKYYDELFKDTKPKQMAFRAKNLRSKLERLPNMDQDACQYAMTAYSLYYAIRFTDYDTDSKNLKYYENWGHQACLNGKDAFDLDDTGRNMTKMKMLIRKEL